MVFTSPGDFVFHVGGNQRQSDQLGMGMFEGRAGTFALILEDRGEAPAAIQARCPQAASIGAENIVELFLV